MRSLPVFLPSTPANSPRPRPTEEGNTVIVAPDGNVIAGQVRQREETLIAGLDLRAVATARRQWILPVTTTARTCSGSTWIPHPAPPVTETTVIETNTAGAANSAAAISQLQGGQDEHRTSEDTHRT